MKTKTAYSILAALACAVCLSVVPFGVAGFTGSAADPADSGAMRAFAAPASSEPVGLAAGELQAQKAKSAAAASKPTKAQIRRFKKAAADFSVGLFARCVAAKGKGANVTVSPYSVMNALAMTANGAAGKTAKEMLRALAGGAGKAELNRMLSWYSGKLSNSGKARLRNANAIWYHDDGTLKMKKRFLKACREGYGASVTPADFSDGATVESINSWVAGKTNNMIKRVLDRLDPDDRVALVNALYFDAKWKAPFEKDSTRPGTFTTASGKKREVDMMHGQERSYIEGDGVRGFVKPYARGYSYVALLPDEGVPLKDFVASLDGDKFRALLSGATDERVDIAMPRHTLDYANDSMEEQLAAMGIRTAFTDGADFSKMGDVTDGKLCLGRVAHKTKVRVDEAGTKAAAATAVVARATSALIDDVKVVTLDRPFVYAIVDNTAKLPIFIGTVNTIGK